jgi:EAL domain-containing protein (putative c-di-GMP-specific phosphodiesterase class I)
MCKNHNNKNLGSYIIVPSIGVYLITEKNVNIQQMQNSAVMAKALVKGDHENMIAVYNSNMRKEMSDRKVLEDELEHAIANKAFSLVFQPQFKTASKKLSGVEALIRWQKEDGSFVPPAEFIPIAEDRGFIKDLDRLVFEMACDAQKEFEKNGHTIDISVNVSQQTLYDLDFYDKYMDIVRDKDVDVSHIHIEITESTLFENHKMFIKLIRRLKKTGFKILMDDFGTGYSSIMLLKSMPIDFLKLDKSFVDDYNDPRGRSIIECIITMAKKLGIVLIAEGVETEEQYLYIKEQGCEITQGYYFSKPVSLNEVEKLLD